MRVILLGADGQLGSELAAQFAGHDLTALTQGDLDITREEEVRRIADYRPDVVVNATGFTDVPRCETELAAAFAVNAIGIRTLAMVCHEAGARLLHVSTDYVFDGKKGAPYVETDTPCPINAYGVTKLAGEHFVRAICSRHYIVRSSGLYGLKPALGKGYNFSQLMLQLAKERGEVEVVTDEVLTPTFTLDLARQIGIIIEREDYGVFHAANEGQCSWFEFTQALFELAGVKATLRPTTAAAFGSPVARPSYSVLENARLKQLGMNAMRHWREALADYVRRSGLSAK